MSTATSRIRLGIINAVASAGRGHFGGALSCVDILHAIYKFKKPEDKVILSKGHAAVALYSTLAEFGYIPKEELLTLNQGGRLGEHPDRKIPGVDADSGSLGQGLGIACGMALTGTRVFVVMGDGECQEGSVWEAAMFAAHHDLPITLVIDRNGFQVHGSTEGIVRLESLAAKWRSFGWMVSEVNGHDEAELTESFSGTPHCIIARTTKGKGVSFMEGGGWHHGSLTPELLDKARRELGA